MSSARNLYEVFQKFEAAKTTEEKKQVLRENNSYALRGILRANFHPNIKFLFEKLPDYKPSDAPLGLGYTNIETEIDRIYLFEQGNPKAPAELTQARRSQLLAQILESLEAKEAEVYGNTILKKLKVKGLTKNLVTEVYPQLLD